MNCTIWEKRFHKYEVNGYGGLIYGKKKDGEAGIETSLLGFGCMRFPVTAEGKIDEPLAEKMLDKAIAEASTT